MTRKKRLVIYKEGGDKQSKKAKRTGTSITEEEGEAE